MGRRHNQPIFQLVPSEYTGTLLAPPPATVDANVVAVASDTKPLAPTPLVAALGSVATVYTVSAGIIPLSVDSCPKILSSWLKYKRKTLFN